MITIRSFSFQKVNYFCTASRTLLWVHFFLYSSTPSILHSSYNFPSWQSDHGNTCASVYIKWRQLIDQMMPHLLITATGRWILTPDADIRQWARWYKPQPAQLRCVGGQTGFSIEYQSTHFTHFGKYWLKIIISTLTRQSWQFNPIFHQQSQSFWHTITFPYLDHPLLLGSVVPRRVAACCCVSVITPTLAQGSDKLGKWWIYISIDSFCPPIIKRSENVIPCPYYHHSPGMTWWYHLQPT